MQTKWFTDILDQTYQPYNVRGLYNQHQSLVLNNKTLYVAVLDRLAQLKEIHQGSGLDLQTIENLVDDIEADSEIREHLNYKHAVKKLISQGLRGLSEYEQSDLIGPEMKRQLPPREEMFNINYDEPVKVVKNKGGRPPITTHNPSIYNLKSDNTVLVDFNDESDNLLEKLEKEAVYVAMQEGITQAKAAKMLGVSIRTLRNKIRKYFEQSVPN